MKLAYRKCKIGDLGKVVTGRTPPSSKPECFGEEYPFVTPTDMHDKKSAHTTERYLSPQGAVLLKNNLIPSGSVAVSCIGWQMGKSILISRPSFTNQQLNTVIPHNDVNSDYLYYLLTTKREELFSIASATGVRTPILNKSSFCNIDIEIPDLATQRKISSLLSNYDNLIENNNRRIAILEDIAQSLYREWFVKFRFPGYPDCKFIDSSLGKIPEGWSVKSVSDVIKRKPAGTNYTQDNVVPEGNVIVIDQSRDEILGYHNNEPDHVASSDKPIAIFGDHTCKMQLMVQPFSVAPNVVPFIPEVDFPSAYIFYLVSSLVETKEYKRHWTELNAKQVLLTSLDLADKFSDLVKPMLNQINILKKKNLSLCISRDLLLPKLISGQIVI